MPCHALPSYGFATATPSGRKATAPPAMLQRNDNTTEAWLSHTDASNAAQAFKQSPRAIPQPYPPKVLQGANLRCFPAQNRVTIEE